MDAWTALLTLEAEPVRAASVVEWWGAVRLEAGAHPPLDAALLAGFRADRLGYAFVGGYACALRALVPDLDPTSLPCLCATEEGGNHPRAIRARLARSPSGGFSLTGDKRWVTLAPVAEEALVVASVGEREGRNDLRVARIGLSRAGVKIESLPEMPFVPEVPHAAVLFDAVAVSEEEILQGDGYLCYLKPFRTVEDIHVQAALAGYLLAAGRRACFPREMLERLMCIVASLGEISRRAPLDPATHVALAGTLAESALLMLEIEAAWDDASSEERARFERDRGLLAVAGKARAARRESAWSRLGKALDD